MISVTDLEKTYKHGKVKALKGVSLEVAEGQVIGLIGPNGAGKTTLMECMLGLVWPTAGSILINGYTPTHLEVKKITAFLPERAKYDPWMNAREFLGFHYMLARKPIAEARKRIEESLDTVQLAADARNRPLKTFSKGMLQRIALAQMLVGDPKLCFMDEPTSGLDPISRNIVRDVIRNWKKQNVTVVVNSHNLDEVERVCDRVAFVFGGKILNFGENLPGVETLPVIVKITGPEDAVTRIQEISRQSDLVLDSVDATTAKFILTSKNQLPPLTRALVNAQIDVEEMYIDRSELERLFEEGWRQANK